jgi:hypothetical protein
VGERYGNRAHTGSVFHACSTNIQRATSTKHYSSAQRQNSRAALSVARHLSKPFRDAKSSVCPKIVAVIQNSYFTTTCSYDYECVRSIRQSIGLVRLEFVLS